jgi:uncharacterized membrane protein
MATLSVLKFNDPYGAERVRDALEDMHARQIITLEDEAVVSWPLGEKKPLFPKDALMGETALGGAFWGFLLGLIFSVPLLGAAIGAGAGAGAGAALSSSLEGGGIDQDFIERVGEKVTEGTSALFTLTSEAKLDEVVDELKQYDFEIISTNLSAEQEKKLREAFAQE